MSPTGTTSSAVKTPDPQFHGPLASQVGSEDTTENMIGNRNAHEPAADAYIYD